MVESGCLSLTNPDYVGRIGTSDNADHESPQTAPKLNEHRKSPSGWVSRLELKTLQLQQENQELVAKIELFEENKELTRQVNERKIGELSAENIRLSLRNSSLNYNIRQAQEALAEERRKGESAKRSRDAQITSLHIAKKALQRKIGEFQIELYQGSEAESRESFMDRKSLAAKENKRPKPKPRLRSSILATRIALERVLIALQFIQKRNGSKPRSMEGLGQGNHTKASRFAS